MKDGGPAFPVLPPLDDIGQHPTGYPYPEPGMDLRDYFAAKALQGLMASFAGCAPFPSPRQFAKDAYAQADAMLKAREE